MTPKDTGSLITIDPTVLSRDQTFALLGVLPHDEERYDANTNAINEHIAAHAFRWAKEAEKEGDQGQLDFLETVFLPDDYRADGIWYDATGQRYDRDDYTVRGLDGIVSFDEYTWLDADLGRWDLVEEAARLASIDAEANSGTIEGLATALAVLSRDCAKGATEPGGRPDQAYWLTFITEFAGENYEDGERLG